MTDSASPAAGGGNSTPPARPPRYLASTVKHGFIYFLGNVLSRLVGFIMLPIYTRVLTTADYGILEILAVSGDVLGMLAGLGIRQAVLRLYYQHESLDARNGVVSTASLMLLAIFGTITAVGLALSPWISGALLGPDQPLIYVRLLVITFVFGAIGDIPAVYLQARQQSSTLVLSNFVKLLLGLSLNIYFVVYLRIGVAGVFLSTIIAAACVGGFLAVRMFRETGVRFVKTHARELVAFGSPLVFSQLGSFVLHFSDRYILRMFHPLSVVGVYALSYKLALTIAMIVEGPFNSIWSAKALEIAAREGEKAPPILKSILLQYSIVVTTAAFGAALFASVAVHLLLGPDFQDADRAVPLLALGVTFFCFRNISQTGAMIAKRPGYIAMVTTGAAIAATLLNFLLIPRWGGMGAAAATAGAFGVEFLMMRVFSERAYRIGLSLHEVLAPMLVAVPIFLVMSLAVPDGTSFLTETAIRTAAFGLYVVALSALGILTAEARRMMLRTLREPRAMLNALRSA